jgi:type IV pilus assembly protein PilO
VSSRKPLNPIVQIVLAIVGALIIGAAGYFLLIKPEGAKVKRIKAQEADAQQALAAFDQKVAAARSAPKIRIADVYRLAKAMPSQPDMPDVLLELSQLARDSGIQFNSISPQPEIAVGSFSVLPISVTFNGTFYDLADLLYRLRSLVEVHAGALDATGRLFSVDSLSFGQSPQQAFPHIQATLVIDAYVYGASSAPTSPSTPPAATPPATSTTGTSTTGTSTTSTSTTATTGTTATTPAGASASATGATP